MPSVTLRPDDVSISVADGETVFGAAYRAGYAWPTACRGAAQCGTCHTVVLSGHEFTNPVRPDEAEILARLPQPAVGTRRLACRLAPTGDLLLLQRLPAQRPPKEFA